MGLIPKLLSLVLLVGGLDMAVAIAGEPACEGPYKGRKPTPEELATVLRNHRAWLESDRKSDDERKANLCRADLEGAPLLHANLEGADLSGANLQGVYLILANLEGAHLFGANLREAVLFGANLRKAVLIAANLREADLRDADLQEAILHGANLQRAVYEPKLGTLPNFWTLTRPDNHLDKLVFHYAPAGLIALRNAFKEGGMRTQERQLTYAIEHTKQLQAWNPSWHNPKWKDNRLWLEKLAGKSESLFSYILFELPSGYGMAPGRALWSLFGFIPWFALFYWVALQRVQSHSGLWMLVPADRIAPGRGHEKLVRIRRHPAKTWRERLRGQSRLVRTSLYFSVLSAFHLGWRELNVGTWIARMQPREYTLRATGWVRTVSGLQSLLSVYLLALWVLTYFGRPFE